MKSSKFLDMTTVRRGARGDVIQANAALQPKAVVLDAIVAGTQDFIIASPVRGERDLDSMGLHQILVRMLRASLRRLTTFLRIALERRVGHRKGRVC